jgi:DNA-binding Xre family transcriptional regulator
MIKKDLMSKAGITSSTMAKMGKEQAVSLEVLGRICKALSCNIDNVIEIKY